MPRTTRNDPAYVLRLVSIVEDKQPAFVWLPAPQRGKDSFGGILDAEGSGRWKPKVRCQCGQRGTHQDGLIGGNPPDEVVIGCITPGILDRHLGLANPA